jgi:hypothetical protein
MELKSLIKLKLYLVNTVLILCIICITGLILLTIAGLILLGR